MGGPWRLLLAFLVADALRRADERAMDRVNTRGTTPAVGSWQPLGLPAWPASV